MFIVALLEPGNLCGRNQQFYVRRFFYFAVHLCKCVYFPLVSLFFTIVFWHVIGIGFTASFFYIFDRCNCINGFEGKMCETNKNDCNSSFCLNGGTCLDLINDYRCICAPTFTGKDCSTGMKIKLTSN